LSKTVELLRGMRSKIEQGWTQGCSARNRDGHAVVAYSDDACQWCLIGSISAQAMVNSIFVSRTSAYRILIELLQNRNEKPDLAFFNDAEGRTKEAVLELIDEAISVASVGGYE